MQNGNQYYYVVRAIVPEMLTVTPRTRRVLQFRSLRGAIPQDIRRRFADNRDRPKIFAGTCQDQPRYGFNITIEEDNARPQFW